MGCGRDGNHATYKGIAKPARAAAIEMIRSGLADVGIPDEACVDDDHLDAWVAWKMGDGFVRGEAAWVGSPTEGGYVVP